VKTAPAPPATTSATKRVQLAEASPAFAASPALPMFKAKARATAAAQVGNYAIRISFSDGHSTGIYSYDHLRSICPCAVCAKSAAAKA